MVLTICLYEMMKMTFTGKLFVHCLGYTYTSEEIL